MQHAGALLTELDVLIADGRIAEVAPELSPVEGAAVVDLSGHALLPGFFNAHYHSHDTLAKGMFDSMPLEEWSIAAGGVGRRRSLEEIHARTLLGAVECLRNGITTVQDFANLAFMDDACVDTMLDAYAEAGIRVVFAISVRDRSQLDTIPWSRELVPVNLHERLGVESDDPERQLAFVEHQIDRRGRWPPRPRIAARPRCSADWQISRSVGRSTFTRTCTRRGCNGSTRASSSASTAARWSAISPPPAS